MSVPGASAGYLPSFTGASLPSGFRLFVLFGFVVPSLGGGVAASLALRDHVINELGRLHDVAIERVPFRGGSGSRNPFA